MSGLGLGLAEGELLGLTDADPDDDGLTEGLVEAEGDALTLEDGDVDALGL